MNGPIANKKIDSVAIIGGGLLGTELAYSMALQSPKTGLKITQILKEKGHLTKILPEYLSNWITNKMKSEGVQVFEETTVKSANLDDQGKVNVTTNSGKTVKVDHVVLAIGESTEGHPVANSLLLPNARKNHCDSKSILNIWDKLILNFHNNIYFFSIFFFSIFFYSFYLFKSEF